MEALKAMLLVNINKSVEDFWRVHFDNMAFSSLLIRIWESYGDDELCGDNNFFSDQMDEAVL
ncbi:BgTH12-06391 [Blumeria graminis f. sp. triticale]|nr:BgTH12-06391 [Blumeria graminis f. sp. triticale]